MCDPYTGHCQCFADWDGADCGAAREGDMCNKADFGWNVMHCPKECRAGVCVCGEGTKHPDRPLYECGYAEFYLEVLPEAWLDLIDRNKL